MERVKYSLGVNMINVKVKLTKNFDLKKDFPIARKNKKSNYDIKKDMATGITEEIINQIHAQQTFSGDTLSENAEFTKNVKRRLGLPLLSLKYIDLSLVSPNSYKPIILVRKLKIALNNSKGAKAKFKKLQFFSPGKNYERFFPIELGWIK
jgi:hypothetical protein